MGLSSVPPRKILEALEQTIRNCSICSVKTDVKLDHNLCDNCRIHNKAIQRYAESNIPFVYWSLEMEKHFHGDEVLKETYLKIISDLRKSYRDGVSICFAGGHGLGKQIALDTELPTPNGFITLSELKEGDQLFDEQGNICNVLKLHPINISPESYELTFDDGTKVEACADHQWSVWDRKTRSKAQRAKKINKQVLAVPKVLSTKEIYKTLKFKNGKSLGTNYSIPCTKPINYPEKKLLIDPYVLGCWLGDGNAIDGCIETADQEILNEIEKSGYSINLKKSSVIDKSKSRSYRIEDLVNGIIINNKIGLLTQQLKILNLINNKHIPNDYLYCSYEQRLALLQGLLDTDGTSSKDGIIEISSSFPKLAENIHSLVLSLGIKSHMNQGEAWRYNKRCKDRFRITFTTQLPIFRLKAKKKNIRLQKSQMSRSTHRFIINVTPIESIPMRCITVDSPSHLFLITRNFIATHNTMAFCNVLKRAVETGYSGLYVNLGDIVAVMLGRDGDDKSIARRELLLVDFLVIDEFDPRYMANEKASDLFGKILEEIFRTRSQNGLPIMMCTNSPNITESFVGPIKQSITSLMSTVTIIPVLGQDHRKQGK